MQTIERANNKPNIKKFAVSGLLLGVNLIGIDFLMGLPQLRFAGLVLVLVALIINIGSVISERSSKSKIKRRYKGSRLDITRIIYRYFVINKRYLIISIFGLMIPILIISQTMLLNTNFEQQSVVDFLKDTNNDAFYISYEVSGKSEYTDTSSGLAVKVNESLMSNNLELGDSITSTTLQTQIVSGKEKTEDDGRRWVNAIYTSINTWADNYMDVLKNFPSFNLSGIVTSQDILLIARDWYGNITDYTVDNEIRMISGETEKDPMDNSTFIYFNQTFDYIWIPNQSDFDYMAKHNLDFEMNFIYGSILMPQEKLWSFVEKQNNFTKDAPIFGYPVIVFTRVKIIFPDITKTSLEEIKAKLLKITTDINSWLTVKFSSVAFGGYFTVYSPLLYEIESYQDSLGQTDDIIFLISLPLTLLGIIFVIFVLKLIENRRKKIVATMKMRGSSDSQLQQIIISEMLIMSVISVILGMLLSIPWTVFSLSNSNIIDSSVSNLPIPDNWYWKIPLLGLVFALDVNMLSYQKIFNTKIEDFDSNTEMNQPLWQKYYLDLLLFVISFGFWIYSSIGVGINSELIEILGPIMLFAIIFSTPLVYARYFSNVIGFIFPIVFKKKGGLFKVASKNLSKHKFSTAQLSGFLLLAIMLTSISLIVPSTYVEWNQEKIQYDLGADIYVEGIDSSNATRWNLFSNITEIEAYTEVAKISAFSFEDDFSSEDGPKEQFTQLSLLGIRPENFSNAAYWLDSYDTKNLDQLVAGIKDNNSILMQQDSLDQLGLSVGDKYTYQAGFNKTTGWPISYTLSINDKFDLFPNLVDAKLDAISASSSVVNIVPTLAHINLIKQIGPSGGEYEFGAYVKVIQNANISMVAEKIDEIFGYSSSLTITNIDDTKSDFLKNAETRVIITLLEGMQILTTIMVAIAIFYYSIINLNQRKKEIGIYRSLGMVSRQISTIVLFEILTVVLSGSIFGFLFGYITSKQFFDIATSSTGKEIVPPSVLFLPLKAISFLSLLILSVTVFVGMIATYTITSSETGNILREEQ